MNRRSLFGAVGAVIFSASMHWSGAQSALGLVTVEATGSGWAFDGFSEMLRETVIQSGGVWDNIPTMAPSYVITDASFNPHGEEWAPPCPAS